MPTSIKRYIEILEPIITCALIIAVSWMLDFQNVLLISDPDAFYHYKMAHEYTAHGLFYSQFPWLTASMVGKLHGDLWYGFHLMLAPLAALPDSVADLKTAAALVMAVAGLLMYIALRFARHKLAPLWTLLFMLGAGGQIGRLLMVRPQAVSLGLTALVFAGLIRRSKPITFVACLLLTFVHLNLIGLPILVMAVIVGIEWLITRKADLKTPAIGVMGLIVGMLARPAPFDAVRLLSIQIGQLYLVKMQGIKLDWGKELQPARISYVTDYYGGFLALYLVATVLAAFLIFRKTKFEDRDKISIGSAWLLSALFFAMIFVSAARCSDQWTLFSILFIAGLYTALSTPQASEAGKAVSNTAGKSGTGRPAWLAPAGAIVLVGAVCAQAYPIGSQQLALGSKVTRFRQPCYWLKDHAPAGSIVFSPYWTFFPEMFFWNDHARYIGAMDPIFEYAYSPKLYYEWDSLTLPQYTAYTTSTGSGNVADQVDTYTALTRDFHASYVMTPKEIQPGLFHYLQTNPNYHMQYFDGNMGIFAIRPPNIPLAPSSTGKVRAPSADSTTRNQGMIHHAKQHFEPWRQL